MSWWLVTRPDGSEEHAFQRGSGPLVGYPADEGFIAVPMRRAPRDFRRGTSQKPDAAAQAHDEAARRRRTGDWHAEIEQRLAALERALADLKPGKEME